MPVNILPSTYFSADMKAQEKSKLSFSFFSNVEQITNSEKLINVSSFKLQSEQNFEFFENTAYLMNMRIDIKLLEGTMEIILLNWKACV